MKNASFYSNHEAFHQNDRVSRTLKRCIAQKKNHSFYYVKVENTDLHFSTIHMHLINSQMCIRSLIIFDLKMSNG